MPLLILAALVVIVLMLYIALGGKEGAPTISLNRIMDFIMPKTPAGEAAQDEEGPAPASAGDETPEVAKTAADATETAAPETETSAEAQGRPETQPDGGAPPKDAAFASMEELTEFYRKEAERLTGIKH
jgi:hypothetical protein